MLCLLAGFMFFPMVHLINQRLPDGERWDWLDVLKYSVFKEYRRLYPEGKLVMYCIAVTALAFLAQFLYLWQTGMLPIPSRVPAAGK